MADALAKKSSQVKSPEQKSSREPARQPAPASPYGGVLALQRSVGNQAVSHWLGQGLSPLPSTSAMLQRKCACGNAAKTGGECEECSQKKRLKLQTKLTVNEPGDIYEQEADRIAEQVMAAPVDPKVTDAPPSTQHLSGQSTGSLDGVPASVKRTLASPGQPLEPALRQDMEQRFGHDFSAVRVHSGEAAEQSAQEVNALAYTVGHNIVFSAGRLTPGTHEGRRLIAHELTHVVQQSNVSAHQVSSAHDAGAALTSSPSTIRFQTPPVQRATLMRARDLDSTIKMRHRVLKGETVFQVSGGGLIVTITSGWKPSEEWTEGGEREERDDARPACGESPLRVTLTKKNPIWDDEYGTCEFEIGATDTKQWTNLPDGDYFLTFVTGNTNPNCMLEGSVKATSATGLTGDTCTQLPPGPLEVLHDALALAGLIPALGAVPDAIDTSIYVVQGDWENAGLSAAAIIPIFGDAASLGRIGARTVARIEGKAVLKIGKEQITGGLKAAKAAKVASRALKRPTFKALRAAAAIDEKLLDMALQHRRLLVEQGENFGTHNIAVIKVLIDGEPAILSARNTVKELHSEARLIGQIDDLIAKRKRVEVLQIYSERIPCTRARCLQAINARFPKADVFFSVSEELAESAGSRAEALKVVYGLKP